MNALAYFALQTEIKCLSLVSIFKLVNICEGSRTLPERRPLLCPFYYEENTFQGQTLKLILPEHRCRWKKKFYAIVT